MLGFDGLRRSEVGVASPLCIVSSVEGGFVMEEKFECVVHHSGDFDGPDPTEYSGTDSTWRCDPDRWSYFEVVDILKEMGYTDVVEIRYKDPSVGLKLLIDDKSAMEMVNIANLHGNVHMYVVHPISQPEIIEKLDGPEIVVEVDEPEENIGPDVVNEPVIDDVSPEEHQGGMQADEHEGGLGEGCSGPGLAEGLGEGSAGPVHAEGEAEGSTKGCDGVGQHEELVEDEIRVQDEEHGQGEQNENESEEGEDSAKDIHFDDSEEEVGEEDGFEPLNVDSTASLLPCGSKKRRGKGKRGQGKATGSKTKKTRGRPRKAPSKVVEHEYFSEKSGTDEEHEVVNEATQVRPRGLSDTDYTSEELESGGDSDEDDAVQPRIKFPLFKLPSKMADYKWELGTYFVSKEEFKEAIRTYAVHSGRNLKFKKNDLERVKVICRARCEWEAYCAKLPDQDTWQLRKIVDKHTCSREFRVKLLNAKWLSKKLHNSVKENPKIKLNDIMEKANKKWNSGISMGKAYRARTAAMDLVDGSFREQYSRIYDYGHELLRSNHGSTVKITTQLFEGDEGDLEHPERPLCPHFQRMYICFSGCRQSFLKCRPIIGLDGAFLKGYYGGQILAAIGRDPNDQMLPVAFAVVEGETKETWTWFLDLLITELGGTNVCSTYTFISDQQKGLLPAIQELLPGVNQRFCVRHLYNNFRKRHAGQQLKQLMWRAAKATYPQAWERIMKEIKKVNVEAFKYLMQIPPRYWSKSRFTPGPKCDTLLNNMSEAFNSVIVGSRAKPIVTMLEEIRVYLMERWASNRLKIASYNGSILPRIKKRLDRESEYTNEWMPRWAGCDFYEVRHITGSGDKFVVNLQVKECSCRKWMLTGIPCCHAISCMRHTYLNPEDYIPAYYRKEAYEACYESVIYPANGPNLWPNTDYTDLQPPPVKRQPGRPKKRRNKEPGELKKDNSTLRKVGLQQRCSRCHQHGHNKARCPLPPQPETDAPEVSTNAVPQASTNDVPQASSQPAPMPSSQPAANSSSQPTQQTTSTTAPVTGSSKTNSSRSKRKGHQSATQPDSSRSKRKGHQSSTQPDSSRLKQRFTAASQPAPMEPAAPTEPAATKQATPKAAAKEPAAPPKLTATKRAAPKPAATEPPAPNPAANKSAMRQKMPIKRPATQWKL